jgi:large subunit ribosomal protein L10
VNREQKNKIVSTLTSHLGDSKNIYFTDISGLNSKQTSNLRRLCFDRGVSVSVVKNTLLKIAMDACDKDFSSLDVVLKGNTTLMTSDVSNAPAQVIKSFLNKNKLDNPTLKGGHVEESVYLGHDQLGILASLKSKEELIGDVMMLLQSPVNNLLSSLSSAKENITGILKSLEDNPVSKSNSEVSKDISSDNNKKEQDKESSEKETN